MSALKTWILFFCAVFLLAACSDDSNPQKVEEGADAGSSGSAGSVVNGSAGSVNGETIVKPGDKIVINGGKDTILVADATGSLYYSSGVFCWTEGCEKKYASSSSTSKPTSSATKPSGSSSSTGSQPKSSATKPSSSSQAPAISVDSRAPTVDKANLKLTDIRNNKTYGLLKIGTVYWMTSNLTYKPNTGFYCDATVSVDKPGPGEEKETVAAHTFVISADTGWPSRTSASKFIFSKFNVHRFLHNGSHVIISVLRQSSAEDYSRLIGGQFAVLPGEPVVALVADGVVRLHARKN